MLKTVNKSPHRMKSVEQVVYKGQSNENLKSVIQILNTARLSCKLTTVLLVVWRVADRWQYDTGIQHDGAVVVYRSRPRLQQAPKKNSVLSYVFSTEVVKPIEIYRRIKVQYGDACLSLQQVYEWTGKFMKSSRSDEEVQQSVYEWLRSSEKNFFFWTYACTSEALEHLYGTQWRLHRKMKSLFTFCVQ
jgi:hypothetical protein